MCVHKLDNMRAPATATEGKVRFCVREIKTTHSKSPNTSYENEIAIQYKGVLKQNNEGTRYTATLDHLHITRQFFFSSLDVRTAVQPRLFYPHLLIFSRVVPDIYASIAGPGIIQIPYTVT